MNDDLIMIDSSLPDTQRPIHCATAAIISLIIALIISSRDFYLKLPANGYQDRASAWSLDDSIHG